MKLFGMKFGKDKPIEEKSLESTLMNGICAGLSGLVKDKPLITPYRAAAYYASVSAVGKAVGLVSTEAAKIQPHLYDIAKKEFIPHKGIEDTLTTPNPDKTKSEFVKAYSSYFLIMGKAYLMALGNVTKAPLEMDTVAPGYISIDEGVRDDYVQNYRYSSRNRGEVIFKRDMVKKRFRYYDRDKEREIWHTKMFNPYAARENHGLSPLDIVYYEVEQHLSASKHNLSMLKKGARLSGLLAIEQELNDPQRSRMRSRIDGEWAGENNTGEIAILDGSKASFSEFSKTMKDMDFLQLKKEVTAAIYNIYSIPLPLISSDTMTFNNYAEAKLALYDMSVLPVVERLYEEMSLFLLPRYGLDPTRYKLWYRVEDIPALRLRITEENKRKKETGIYTTNELRALEGLEPLEGGEVIYQPMNMVPIGTDISALKQPAPTKDRFFEIMEKQMDKRKLSREVLEKIAKERGL